MDVLTWDWRPVGIETPEAAGAATGGCPWSKADTSAAGAPTLAATGGFMVGTLAANDEVENLCLYMGDSLAWDIDDLLTAEFWIKTGVALTTAEQLAFGMASARNDAIDSLTAHATFLLVASTAVLCETDDGTNDNDDKATGQILSTTVKRFCIDFASGLKSVSPPSPSLGGKGQVLFSMDDARGNLMPVCRSLAFDMSNYAAGLQPYVQLQKTGGVTTPAFSLARVRIRSKFPY